MNKILSWVTELQNKLNCEERLKYRQIQSLRNALNSLSFELSRVDRQDVIDEIHFLTAEIEQHRTMLDRFINEHESKKNKAFINSKTQIIKLFVTLKEGSNLLIKYGKTSTDREQFLRELEKVFTNHKYLVVFDLEMTCEANREHIIPEIIEFGLVVVDATSLKTVASFEALVKPTITPKLSDYCTQLTTITQDDVDGAGGFVEVSKDLAHFLSRYQDGIAIQWGNGDMRQVLRDCEYHGVTNPFGSIKPYDLKKAYSKLYYRKNTTGLNRVMEVLGLTSDGEAHRAMRDAEVTSDIMILLRKKWLEEYGLFRLKSAARNNSHLTNQLLR